MRFRFFAPSLLALMLILCPFDLAQDDPHFPQTGARPHEPEDEARVKLERDQAKKRNEERQARIKQDTDRLLQLATELKQYVDKTNENMLSMDVVKKADEIEKLAHSVKEKMKGE